MRSVFETDEVEIPLGSGKLGEVGSVMLFLLSFFVEACSVAIDSLLLSIPQEVVFVLADLDNSKDKLARQ